MTAASFRLVFDARHLALPYTGLGRYSGAMLSQLLVTPRRPHVELVVILPARAMVGDASIDRWIARVAKTDAQYIVSPIEPFSVQHYLGFQRLVDRLRGDLYFYPHFDVPLRVETPALFVVHDLLPLIVPGYVRRHVVLKKAWFRYALLHALKRAQRCYAVSRNTRRDILTLTAGRYADKIGVTCEGPILEARAEAALSARNGKQPYLLYVGDRRPHKNIKRLLDLFGELRRRHCYAGELHLVGSTINYGFDVDSYAKAIGAVRVLGSLDDAQLANAYAGADALLLLSTYEGFGLPVVEAAALGCKVVVSDGGSLAEIAPPGACVLPGALSPVEAAESVARFLSAPAIAPGAEYLKKYSWETAVRTMFPFAVN